MKNIILITSMLLLLFSCGTEEPEQQVESMAPAKENSLILTDEQYKNAGIELGKLTLHDISPLLNLRGQIAVSPQSMVSVSAPLGGYLSSTKLIAGMQISKGDVLARMEDVQYIQLQQDYLSAKTQVNLTEKEFKRQEELNKSQAASDKTLEQARANYELQMVLLKSLEEKLKLIGLNPQNISAQNISKSIPIYSPISGYVSAVNVNLGKYVNPSDVMFELINPDDIHLLLTAFEKDLDKLAVGQKMLAYTNNNPEIKYPLEISLINKNISRQNSAEVVCKFLKYDNKVLLPGMFMNAEIELKMNSSMALPEEAIVRFENKNYVFVSKGDRLFEMEEVEIGNTENGFTEVRISEQFANENFVTEGAYTLLMGLKNSGED